MNQALDSYINVSASECLNEDKSFPVGNIFQPNDDLELRSDESVDPQLLVRVHFQSPVKISSMSIRAPENDEAPQVIQIYQNNIHLDFQEAESTEPVQTLNLEPEMVDGRQIPLRFVKFQNVTSLQLFFVDNQGAERTTIKNIQFYGTTAENMNMAEFKPIKG